MYNQSCSLVCFVRRDYRTSKTTLRVCVTLSSFFLELGFILSSLPNELGFTCHRSLMNPASPGILSLWTQLHLASFPCELSFNLPSIPHDLGFTWHPSLMNSVSHGIHPSWTRFHLASFPCESALTWHPSLMNSVSPFYPSYMNSASSVILTSCTRL